MRFISLFSGIGGLDLGLERAGWTCVAQVECEPFALEVLAKHWPSVPRFTDVRSVSRESLPSCDAIVGGFPCQPHSAIGKQLGSSDDRNLWPEFRRLVAELKPRVVVGENVPGLDRTMLAEVVRDLEELGYSVGVLGLAAATIGAPHLRERRFIVAMADSIGKGLEGHPGNVPVLDKQGREPENEGGSVGQSCISSGNGYQRVRFASECDPNGDGWCSIRDIDPAECDCIGPTEDGVEYSEDADRALWGRRIAQPGLGNQPDGFSSWMVGPGPGGAWPSCPGPQAAWEEPRTDFVIDLRAAKLKALGNAVVPQVAELVGRVVNKWL